MVILRSRARNGGWLVAELMVALIVIMIALIPLAFSFRSEQKLLRGQYNQAVAIEIIDGEMELLHAGDWREVLEGEHPYKVTANAATNLPPGEFFISRTGGVIRLEWRPAKKGVGGKIARDIIIGEN
jgi:hypothetical protein